MKLKSRIKREKGKLSATGMTRTKQLTMTHSTDTFFLATCQRTVQPLNLVLPLRHRRPAACCLPRSATKSKSKGEKKSKANFIKFKLKRAQREKLLESESQVKSKINYGIQHHPSRQTCMHGSGSRNDVGGFACI